MGEKTYFLSCFEKKDSDVHFHTRKTIAAATVISRMVVCTVVLKTSVFGIIGITIPARAGVLQMVASKARERQRKDRRATRSFIESEKSENPLVFTTKKGASRLGLLSRVRTGGQEYILIRNKR